MGKMGNNSYERKTERTTTRIIPQRRGVSSLANPPHEISSTHIPSSPITIAITITVTSSPSPPSSPPIPVQTSPPPTRSPRRSARAEAAQCPGSTRRCSSASSTEPISEPSAEGARGGGWSLASLRVRSGGLGVRRGGGVGFEDRREVSGGSAGVWVLTRRRRWGEDFAFFLRWGPGQWNGGRRPRRRGCLGGVGS